ncbi:MAG: mechanosensitive ion channel family protein [Candidatus Poseidoniaceae archaeon]|nr:mechanosensitive ion channel family protein [Candidatus Poseidoniaceae archaeon]
MHHVALVMLDYAPPTDSTIWLNEYLGFNNLTVAFLTLFVLTAFIVRKFTMWFIPILLRKIITSDTIEENAVRDSDKALGTAVGVGFAHLLFSDFNTSMVQGNSNIIMPNVFSSLVPSLLQLVVSIAIIIWALRLVELVKAIVMVIDDDDELDGTEKTLISAIQSALRFVIIFLGSVFIADSFGFDLTSLIAGLGISGIALALAAKDTISNFFGAVTVLLDRPFKVGDWIVVGSSEGEVIEITLRTTLIRTSLDTVISMPNANLVNKPVENYGKRRWRRWQTQLHLDINSDPEAVEKFCDAVLGIISENQFTTKVDASFCRVNAISAQSLDIAINLYWDISSGIQEREQRELLILSIMSQAKANELEFYDGRIRQQR